MLMARSLLAVTCAAFALVAVPASANTSHDGWPQITGILLMNKTDSSRPLDARPGPIPSTAPTRVLVRRGAQARRLPRAIRCRARRPGPP